MKMKRSVRDAAVAAFLVVLPSLAGTAVPRAPFQSLTDAERAARPLGIAPRPIADDEAPGPVAIDGRRVEWFRHAMDPAWGAVRPEREPVFAIVHPRGGGHPGAPLVLTLHSHGYNAPKLVRTLDKPGDHDVWKVPGEFYQLVPDCSPRPPKDSPDFWWCGANHFATPSPADLASTGGAGGLSPCERRVLDTLEWTLRAYGIDRDRVYVCGNSMGGQGAMGIGMPHGDIFAAIKANVPAGVWFATARLGAVDAEGRDVPAADIPLGLYPDPPVCIDYSSPRDKWSADHDVLFRAMERGRFALFAYWGNFGHANDDARILHCNDIVHSFDWLRVRRDEPYPVFTHASSDDLPPWGREPGAGTDGYAGDISPGQINAYFRWKPIADAPDAFAMDLRLVSAQDLGSAMFTPPPSATADVTLRRLRRFPRAPGSRARWTFGDACGEVVADDAGLYTIPALSLTQTPTRLSLASVPPAAP